MIRFNNVELTDILPVKIEDIVVSPIQLNPVARQRAIQYGAEFVRIGGGERKITVTFALLNSNINQREEQLSTLRNWASIGAEYMLELPQFTNRHLECAVTSLPDHNYRKWWENKLRLEFTCFSNPYWTSNDMIETPCGSTFSIGGSAPPLMKIIRTGVIALSNQTYTNGIESMTFTTIPAGSMVIDLNRQTAAIGHTSFMNYYKPLSSWIVPRIGAYQYINGTGTVVYRERWI